MKTATLRLLAETNRPTDVAVPDPTGGASRDLDVRGPLVDSPIKLEKLLPPKMWEKMQDDPTARALASRIDSELLAPLHFDRENLGTLRIRLRGPEGMDAAKVRTVQDEAREYLERLGSIDHQLAAEIKAGPGWIKHTLNQVRQTIAAENSVLNHAFLADLRIRLARMPKEPLVLDPAPAAQTSREDRPFARLRENPLRYALANCTLHVSGMPSTAMTELLQKMVSKTLAPARAATGHQALASHLTGTYSTVASGYFGPPIFPDLEGLQRNLQPTFKLNAAHAAHAGLSFDVSRLSSPVGIIEIALREPQKQDGAGAWIYRLGTTPHRNLEIIIVASNEVENRGHSRVADRAIAIGLNAAVPEPLAARIGELLSQGRGMELMQHLLESPPRGKAGEIVRWIRSGLIDPLLNADGDPGVSWDRATSEQKARAFERYAVTVDGKTHGEFSTKLHALCREARERAA